MLSERPQSITIPCRITQSDKQRAGKATKVNKIQHKKHNDRTVLPPTLISNRVRESRAVHPPSESPPFPISYMLPIMRTGCGAATLDFLPMLDLNLNRCVFLRKCHWARLCIV